MSDLYQAAVARHHLADMKDKGLLRQLRELDSAQGPVVRTGDRDVINFCSNDYLGMANDKRLKITMHQALDRYGVGSGASQLVCGRSRAHEKLERQLAACTNRDRALVFSTGYMANLAVATALGPGRAGRIYEDRLNHASLIDGAILSRSKLVRYKHKDVRMLASKLSRDQDEKLVLTDAVFSMDGDIAPLAEIAELCLKFHAMLAVDDAHGFGILGERGLGCMELFGLSQQQAPVLIITFGKALGVFGACVAGPEDLIETLVQKARTFIYTTALPPAIAAAVSASLEIIVSEEDRRASLKKLISYFREGAQSLSLPLLESATPIQPLIIGDNAKTVSLSRNLLDKGFLVAPIRPPTVPENSARLRITLTSSHTIAQVDGLLDKLAREYIKVK